VKIIDDWLSAQLALGTALGWTKAIDLTLDLKEGIDAPDNLDGDGR
jgi:hypothetical protein